MLLIYVKNLLSNFYLMNYGLSVSFTLGITIPSRFIKIWGALKLAFAISIPTWFVSIITNWTLSNKDYIGGVLLCIAIDHLIGSIYHAFKLRDFSWKQNAIGVIQKLGLCVLAIGLFEIIHNTVREVTIIYDYLKVTTRLVVILYPAGSAFVNMSKLTNGRFPPLGWINKIKVFNENLDIKDLKKFSNEPNSKLSP